MKYPDQDGVLSHWLARYARLKLLEENLDMKLIIWLIGAVTLLTVSGCDWDRDHHHHEGHYGGYYGDDAYHHYGHGEYHSYDRDRDWH